MSFDRIKGQQPALDRLRKYLGQETGPAGTYLFSGPEGVGKFLAARIFAMAANCLQKRDDSCGSCPSCLKAQKNNYPDLHLIDNGSDEITVEEVRQLQQDMGMAAFQARCKFFIINNAHNLNIVSANALLKTLEEPGKNNAVVLVTDKPQLLLKTIVSRCRQVKFGPLERCAVEKFLSSEYGLDGRRSHFLAYFSEGRLGAAVRLAEAANDGSDIFIEKNRIIDALTAGQQADLDRLVGQDREKFRLVLGIAASWYRDVLLMQQGAGEEELINADRIGQLADLRQSISGSWVQRNIQLVSDSLRYLEQSVNLKLLLSHLKENING